MGFLNISFGFLFLIAVQIVHDREDFIIVKLLMYFLFLFFSAGTYADDLSDWIYDFSLDNSGSSKASAFVVLAGLDTTEELIKKIKKDYSTERDPVVKYYYEYFLAKRTQEVVYISKFIASSRNNKNEILSNNTDWVSIVSPFYDQLAYYAMSDDAALRLIFELVEDADGAFLSVVSGDLARIEKINPNRFLNVAEEAGISKMDLNILMESD